MTTSPATNFVSNEEVIQAARRHLDESAWDYLVGGSESETSMRRNRAAFDRIAFRPRVLVDVSKLDASTTFLGQKLRIPVMLAPVGSLQRFTPEGGLAAAKAAAEFGTMQTVSTVTEPGLEKIAAAGSGPKIFQLYVQGDWKWIEDIIHRAKQAGYVGIVVTVDNARYSRRERPMIHGYAPMRPAVRTPAYGGMLTWDLMDRIRDLTDLPFGIKGVATAEDAATAIEHGFNIIWVSNHGGRQLDHSLGTLDMLPEIVDAVGGKADIVLDGGVLRGSDVVKAIALGAKAVAIGKLQGWGLAAAGQAGVNRVLEIMEDEVLSAIALLGVTSVGQLNRSYVCRAETVTSPHEMSAWVNMPVGRIP